MKTTYTVLLAAGLVAGLALAGSETFAAGPMIAPVEMMQAAMPRYDMERFVAAPRVGYVNSGAAEGGLEE